MEESLEFRLPLKRRRAWVREVPIAAANDGPRIAFKLLLVFLLFLYSNIAVIYKLLEPYRPVAVMAAVAIVMMLVELGQARRRFLLTWPQGVLLIAFLGLAFVSSFDAMWARLAFEENVGCGEDLTDLRADREHRHDRTEDSHRLPDLGVLRINAGGGRDHSLLSRHSGGRLPRSLDRTVRESE
jgi:hypothetical protein